MRTENNPAKRRQIVNCRDCTERPACRSICSSIEDQLPSMEKGRVDGHQVCRSVLAPSLTRFEEAKLVLKFKRTFSKRQKQIISAYYMQGLTMKKIAKRFGITISTVADCRWRVLRKIAKILKT